MPPKQYPSKKKVPKGSHRMKDGSIMKDSAMPKKKASKPRKQKFDDNSMGLKKSCSEEDLKKRYYKLAKEYHPDRSTGSHNLFVKLKQAYDNIKSIFI